MSDLKFEIDVDRIAETFGELKSEVEGDIVKGVGSVAEMTHARVLELARDRLGSLSQMYMENVEFDNPEPNFWIVSLKNPALWVESGVSPGFMEALLNGKSSKINKKGERYAVIPFKHNENPSRQAPQAQSIANEIKDFLKKKKINYQKIEYDSSGSPRLGKIHGPFNVGNKNARLKEGHKSPATYGVSIYQRMKDGQPRKDVMTFRVIHEKHRAEGKWQYPGKQGEFLMDEALDWAMKLFDNQILPEILRKHGG